MSLAKQALLTLMVAAAVLVLWVLYIPSAQPVLASLGILEPMQRIGIVASVPEAEATAARGRSGGAVRVIAETPETRVMNDIVTAIGSARAVRSVTLKPEVSGRIVALRASSGDEVQKGDLLVELDSAAAQIALDRAELMLADARRDAERLERLRSSGAATDLQRQEAELALQTAELELRQAEFELSQHRILAPVSGWVGILAVEVGDQIGPADEITRLDDRSSVIVDFRVPERVVAQLRIGGPVTAAPLGALGEALPGQISALDNRVDEASRTLRVQAAIPNAKDDLRSGMAFSIRLELEGESHPSVDPLAIQWGSEGAFVWIARGGKAMELPIRILQRNSDAVLIRAELLPGDLVVVEGVQALRPGAEVMAVDRGASLAQGASPEPKT